MQDHAIARGKMEKQFKLDKKVKKKKIRFIWTCSNFVRHEHRWKWSAWICGRCQYFRARLKYEIALVFRWIEEWRYRGK